ncbi:cytochrome b/b6 domain-containing protein [Leucobacter denitrificans]|uniref:Cytochrome b/b6 domain-containing protein n=1 Tax=Leucobacter denitrificans TaxID=683042 RepID=A0A7G9S2W8_9MICO|nr:cytochrome b/b6 domain-containing protein [Leucobacter denitrificans]QNN62193.1 cytochrome b/b6 domain-containing protein [Leucobacter denitrificans]
MAASAAPSTAPTAAAAAPAEAPAQPVAVAAAPVAEPTVAEPQAPGPVAAAEPAASAVDQAAPAPTAASTKSVPLRRGLPRVAGGDPWPPEGTAAVSVAAPAAAAGAAAAQSAPAATPAPVARHAAESTEAVASDAGATSVAAAQQEAAAPREFVASETPLRRGLPRTPGGEPWPAEGFAPVQVSASAPAASAAPATETAPAAESAPAEQPVRRQRLGAAAEAPAVTESPAAPAAAEPAAAAVAEPAATAAPAKQAAPAAATQSAPAAKPAPASKPKREPIMIGEKTLGQWVKLGILGVVGAIIAAGILVLAARGVTTLPGVPEWLERYPGEYDLPESAEPGFPWWARWSHFLNIFLMVLIIRSGILVRQQQKPPAFFTPKRGGKKISINLWLHTSLDVLWLANGVIFVVMLFVSGHWMRIVPTSWEVFPNALSALLQYMTLDWPAEHGWVNYNSLQQIMYFLIIFIAAPVAAITGVRMSEWWPKNAEKLNKFYPAPLARALHFPTMLFFVMFILVHVFLVFSTGALRNLNHMFAGTDVVNWTGFWFFALAIFLTAAGWVAARPLVLAPIASLFGKVSNR